MTWMYLINDVKSNNKKTIYGRSGDRVYIISNHYSAVIVSNEQGNKFSTSINNLTLKK
jgi:hypothetical protein